MPQSLQFNLCSSFLWDYSNCPLFVWLFFFFKLLNGRVIHVYGQQINNNNTHYKCVDSEKTVSSFTTDPKISFPPRISHGCQCQCLCVFFPDIYACISIFIQISTLPLLSTHLCMLFIVTFLCLADSVKSCRNSQLI